MRDIGDKIHTTYSLAEKTMTNQQFREIIWHLRVLIVLTGLAAGILLYLVR